VISKTHSVSGDALSFWFVALRPVIGVIDGLVAAW
jgi:hypothetical protein